MRFLARLAQLLRDALGTGVGWLETAIRYPFWLMFGSAEAKPNYEPQLDVDDLMDVYRKRRNDNLVAIDRDGIDTVVRYCKSLPSARRTFDLSGLKSEVRNTLLGMDQNELDSLSKSKLSVIRRFINGEPHGVYGVPTVVAEEPRDVSPAIQLQNRIRSRMKSGYDPYQARQSV